MNQIVKQQGCNQYEIPHLNKAKLERAGHLPLSIEVRPVFSGVMAIVAADAEYGAPPAVVDSEIAQFLEHAEPLLDCITWAKYNYFLEENGRTHRVSKEFSVRMSGLHPLIYQDCQKAQQIISSQ